MNQKDINFLKRIRAMTMISWYAICFTFYAAIICIVFAFLEDEIFEVSWANNFGILDPFFVFSILAMALIFEVVIYAVCLMSSKYSNPSVRLKIAYIKMEETESQSISKTDASAVVGGYLAGKAGEAIGNDTVETAGNVAATIGATNIAMSTNKNIESFAGKLGLKPWNQKKSRLVVLLLLVLLTGIFCFEIYSSQKQSEIYNERADTTLSNIETNIKEYCTSYEGEKSISSDSIDIDCKFSIPDINNNVIPTTTDVSIALSKKGAGHEITYRYYINDNLTTPENLNQAEYNINYFQKLLFEGVSNDIPVEDDNFYNTNCTLNNEIKNKVINGTAENFDFEWDVVNKNFSYRTIYSDDEQKTISLIFEH